MHATVKVIFRFRQLEGFAPNTAIEKFRLPRRFEPAEGKGNHQRLLGV